MKTNQGKLQIQHLEVPRSQYYYSYATVLDMRSRVILLNVLSEAAEAHPVG